MATEGSASYAARELGQGWKVNPYININSGETATLADISGQGSIKHIWITDSAKAGRLLILRIYFDGHENPAVEVPLSDFFANADYKEFRQLSSLAVCVNPNKALNSYFEMLFSNPSVSHWKTGVWMPALYIIRSIAKKSRFPRTLCTFMLSSVGLIPCPIWKTM